MEINLRRPTIKKFSVEFSTIFSNWYAVIYVFALSSSCNYNSNTYKEIIYTFFGSNEMGGACGTRGGVVQKGFGGESRGKETI